MENPYRSPNEPPTASRIWRLWGIIVLYGVSVVIAGACGVIASRRHATSMLAQAQIAVMAGSLGLAPAMGLQAVAGWFHLRRSISKGRLP